MAAKQNIYGWDGTQWVKILVNAAGKLIIDPTEILEATPTDGETAKAAQSNWSHDHAADPNAHPGAKNADLTISKDTPAVILKGTETYGQEWQIKEIVYGTGSYLAFHNVLNDVDFYIYSLGQAECRRGFGIASDESLGEPDPYLLLERQEAGAKLWLLTHDGVDVVFHTTGAGRVKRDAATMIDTGDVDNTPVDGATTDPISSNWAYDHKADASAHHVKYTDAEALAAAVQAGVITDGVTKAPTHDAVYDVRFPTDPTLISDAWKRFLMVYGI